MKYEKHIVPGTNKPLETIVIKIHDDGDRQRVLTFGEDATEEEQQIILQRLNWHADPDSKPISVLDVGVEDITPALLSKLEDNECYCYEDAIVDNMPEHLFGLTVDEKLQEKGVPLLPEQSDELTAIFRRMDDQDCSYFRVRKF